MTPTTTCPDKDTVDDLLANRLPSDQAAQIRAHIAQCPACSQRMGKTGPQWLSDTVVVEKSSPQTTVHPWLSPPRSPGELGWLGEYRVLGVLGEGGMAIVYDAEDSQLRRPVALKVLKPEVGTPSSRERFLSEARVVASLHSEHVVDVYAFGEANNTPYMAMEKLVGETLATRLARDRSLPVTDALAIAREAAEGLVDLHAKGLIHRDLKPDNLWLETHSKGHVEVKLIDFGIARQATGNPMLTTPGQVIGTPIYMAPEQASGGDIDARADLYALGCTLYRMLAGRTPFDSVQQNTMAVLSAVIRGDIEPIAKVAPNLSPAVAALVQQLLENDRHKRPATAVETVTRLRELEREERASPAKTRMIQAGAVNSKRRTPRRIEPWSVALGVIAIVAALAVGGAAFWDRFSHPVIPVVKNGGAGKKKAGEPPVLTTDPLKVGLLFSLSDATRIPEEPILDAVEFAIQEINASGGVLGRQIDMIVEDGASDPAVFAKKAAKLIDEEKVAVVFGCWTSPSRRCVAEVCADPKRDMLLFYPGNTEGIEDYKNVVYLGGAPNQILTPLIRYAYADLQRRKVYVVGSDSVYSRVINTLVEHEVKQLGAMVVGTRHIVHGETDFKPVVDEIKSSGADFVVSSLSGTYNVWLARSLRGAGIGPPQVPTAWLTVTETYLASFDKTLVGDYSAGCYFANVDMSESSFVRKYHKQFGKLERLSDTMEAAYYGVYLWKQAVEKSKSTRTADVRAALKGMELRTADGLIKIDPSSLHAWHIGQVSKVVLNDKEQLTFEAVHRTPLAIEPQLYPPWKTRDEWNEFLDKLYQEWGKNWESKR